MEIYKFRKGDYIYYINIVTGETKKHSSQKPGIVIETLYFNIHDVGNDKYVEVWSDDFHSNVLVKLRPV